MTVSSLRNVRAKSVLDAAAVVENVGDVDGIADGSFVGTREGVWVVDGSNDGFVVGTKEGALVTVRDCVVVGTKEGERVRSLQSNK